MNQKKGVQWLYGQLPDLVGQGVLSSERAAALKSHYGPVAVRSARSIALITFSVIGALAIGMGIILILAYNWSDLSRPLRAGISMGLLVCAQALCAWVLVKRRESVAWREGSGTFLMLSIAATIALISQTYQIPGDLGGFLFTWMILSAPIMYVLNASAPAALYVAGITWWAGYAQVMGGHALWYWPLAAAFAPHLWRAIKEDPYGLRAVRLSWAAALSLCVAIGIVLEKMLPGLWIIVYSSYFAVIYLAGSHWFGDASNARQRPFQAVGATGIVVMALVFTFEEPWRDIGWSYYRTGLGYNVYAAIPDYVILAGLLIAAVYLLVSTMDRNREDRIVFGVFPFLAVAGFVLCSYEVNTLLPVVLFNLYVLALGVAAIAKGIRSMRLDITNAGLLTLSALLLVRFFDSNLGFVERGIGFILVGAGFLITNLVLLKRGNRT